MKPIFLRRLAFAMLAVCSPAFADDDLPGSYSAQGLSEDEDHMMLTWLGVAMNDYANAMAAWMLDATRQSDGRLSPRALQRFQQQLLRATFAYFEYRYRVDGEWQSRIYLAASGRSFATFIAPGTIGIVAPSRHDASYFMADDVVRHATAGGVDGTDVTPRPPTQGLPNRHNDAEIKVLQSIKRDIDAGIVQAGGELLGFVSAQPCDSCHPALRKFAEETRAQVHVNYVAGENRDGMRTPAWMALRAAREAVVADITALFVPPPTTRSPSSPDPAQPSDEAISRPSVCGAP